MTILMILLVAGILTIATQRWDEHERAKQQAIRDAFLASLEKDCTEQAAKQAAHVQRHEDDPRTAMRTA